MTISNLEQFGDQFRTLLEKKPEHRTLTVNHLHRE